MRACAIPGAAGPLLVATLLLAGGVTGAAARDSGRSAAASPSWIWWEAESPSATNFPATHPFGPWDDKTAQMLSGGRWIGATEPGKTLFLEYQVVAPAAGEYQFYARKFWLHGPFRWRFDGQPWRLCGRDVALLDRVGLAKFIEANWVHVGGVKLGPGPHRLRIELTETAGGAAFDCFILTTGRFDARGKLKPGERYGSAPEGWFPFEPDPDPFGAAALDLRGLNERSAGDGGFIQTKGASFVHEKTGQPVRFWAVNAGHEILNHDRAALERFARRLAKVGVNMVRLQGPLWRAGDVSRVDEAKVARIHDLVAALKGEGIYLALSSYFPVWLQPKGVPGLEGYTGQQSAFAVSFFNERLQEIQRGWWRAALAAKSPRTGLALGEDPTLALIEIQNEDSLFFWTFAPYESVPAPQMAILERQFGQWLAARYGGLAAARATWGAGTWGVVRGDDLGEGRAGFLPLWDISPRRNPRARDTAEFLAGIERSYYDQMRLYLKRDLGFRGSVTGSNWKTADARVLGPLDKWANAGCDFMDRHGYTGGPHQGERAGYMISSGDRYDDASALLFQTDKERRAGDPGDPLRDLELPIMDLAYGGKPSTVSEIGWTMPNRFRAEMPALAAAYGALQGTDGIFFFTTSDIEWPQVLGKFSIADPAGMGQFPAAALLYRQGLVKTADAVVHLEGKLADLYALRGLPGVVDPLAFLVGRVEADVTVGGGASRVAPPSGLIDREKKTARSATGELLWDWGRGLATVDAPGAQGAIGFLARAGRIALGDVTIASPLEYGAVLLVAMDGLPLRASRRMLLQVMSEDANSGWSAPGVGLRSIADVGGPPIVVRKLAGRVSLRRADAASLRVEPLDFNGYQAGPALGSPPGAPPGVRDIELLPATFHYLVER